VGILTRRDGTLDDDNHFHAGSTDLEKKKNRHHYTYVNGQSVAHLTEAGDLDVTSRLTAYDTQAGSGESVVQEGDSLQTIAQRVYGDAGLWYVLAEANAIQGNDDLVVGTTLRTPAVKTVSNSSSTYQPYDPSQVIGPTTPDLPWITPPPKEACNAVGIILMAVAAAVVIALAPESMGIVGHFLTGIAASTASQIVGIGAGVVVHFSLRSVVGEGIANALTFGISNWAQSAAEASQAAAEAAKAAGTAAKAIGMSKYLRGSLQVLGTAAASTIGNKIAGVEGASFSWRAIAANAVTQGITKGISHGLHLNDAVTRSGAFGENLATNFVGGVVSTHGEERCQGHLHRPSCKAKPGRGVT
jgi:hypothetical protein